MNPLPLDPFSIIAWLTAGGALGGAAEYVRQIVYRDKALRSNSDALSLWPFLVLLLFSAVVGLSGAIAIQFIFVLLQSFKADNTNTNILFLFSISVAAGFGARHILPLLTERLKQQVTGIDQKATDAQREAMEAIDEVREAQFVIHLMHALSPNATASERHEAIEELAPRVQDDPTNRLNTILLGRLYRARKDYQSAINVLDNFLRHKEQQGESRDEDYAAALYNKACYYTLWWDETNDERHKDLALESLSASIEIWPENKNDAKSDPDFKPFEEVEEFNRMVEN